MLAAIGAARSAPKRLNVRAGHAKVRPISDLTFMMFPGDPRARVEASTMPATEIPRRRVAHVLLIPIQADVTDSLRTAALRSTTRLPSAIRQGDFFALRLAAA
jgi:hypothetical protein